MGVVGNGVYLAPSTVINGGIGLFAGADYQCGQILTEYDGVVISKSAADQVRNKYQSHSHFIALALGRLTLCGLRDWTIARGCGGGSFVNHAFHAAKRNAKFIKIDNVNIRGQPRWPPERYLHCHLDHVGERHQIHTTERIFIHATRDIKCQEEVFVNYGAGYWKTKSEV